MLKGHAADHSGDKDKPNSPQTDDTLTQDERDELAVDLFWQRVSALGAGMDGQSVPLRAIKSDPSDDKWFRSASGRGVMLLSELRRRLGQEQFDAAMEAFGRAHAGQSVDSASFVAAMNAVGGPTLKGFFQRWLDTTDALPTLELSSASSAQKDSTYIVSGKVLSHGGCAPANVDVTVETEDGETTTPFAFSSEVAEFRITSDKKPKRITVNKYGTTPCTNGWTCNGYLFSRDLEHTLIVYGTRVDATANQIAAEKLQRGIVDRWEHLIVPIKPDTAVNDDDLRGHHVLLIGRPECSELTERLSHALPVTFGPRSFTARGQLYANTDTAVIAAAANPMDSRYTIVCAAGLGSSATLRAAKLLADDAPAPLRVMAANQSSKDIVPPAVELTRELK